MDWFIGDNEGKGGEMHDKKGDHDAVSPSMRLTH
jgi:hypothetical protein